MPQNEHRPVGRPFAMLLGVMVWAVVGFFIAYKASPRFEQYYKDNWVWFFVCFGALIALGLFSMLIRGVKHWVVEKSRRVDAFFTFLVAPVALGLLYLIIILPIGVRTTMFRAVFLLVVCLLPGAMYFLFLETRKHSALGEYFEWLGRLGYLGDQAASGFESLEVSVRDQRVRPFLLKFEAVFGPIVTRAGETAPRQLGRTEVDAADRETEPARSRFERSGILYTPALAVPLCVATVSIVLGWFLVLPPWRTPVTAGRMADVAATAAVAADSAPSTGQPRADLQEGADQPADDSYSWAHVLAPTQTPVNFAFLGAYFYGLQMLFRRYARRDLGPTAYFAVALRIVLAAIGIWVIEVALRVLAIDVQGFLLVAGFVVGVFPLVAWQFVRAAFTKVLGKWALPKLEHELPLGDLDGLTVWHQSRFEEEDIENIPNMATCDLLELLLRTQYPADRVIDWVDQAILYTLIGPDGESGSLRQRLNRHGIRNATTLCCVHHELPEELRSETATLVPAVRNNTNFHPVLRWRESAC